MVHLNHNLCKLCKYFKIFNNFKYLNQNIFSLQQATVDTIKGNFGFLSYEAEEGKKLFFHMSEVKGDGIIQAGDKVEFVVVHHQKTGKYSACSVVKIGYVMLCLLLGKKTKFSELKKTFFLCFIHNVVGFIKFIFIIFVASNF